MLNYIINIYGAPVGIATVKKIQKKVQCIKHMNNISDNSILVIGATMMLTYEDNILCLGSYQHYAGISECVWMNELSTRASYHSPIE